MKKSELELIEGAAKGCTIDELRFRRAYTLAKYEMAKARVMEEVSEVGAVVGRPSGFLGRILGSLNYLDYALLAFRVGSKFYKWRQSRK
ncbi:MAG: hypothetical protein NC111_05805 [Bacteroides sp.]|nr:hypothetical protein [Bacteroides sp.]MCM1414202.1 hypothetical protein [Bacteroides sp.]MCM1472024.1 hypothetical protein [Bacteroides sp.]